MPVDNAGLDARGTSQTVWNVPPSRCLRPDPFNWIVGVSILDGTETSALYLFPNFLHHLVIPQVMATLTNIMEDSFGSDPVMIMKLREIISKHVAMTSTVPVPPDG